MKKYYFIVVLLIGFACHASAQRTFSGRVLDKANEEALPGVIVYIPDLKIGATTDPDGKFLFSELPGRTFMVELKYIGYETHHEAIDFDKNPVITFHLHMATIETKGVVITGSAFSTDPRSTSNQVVSLDKRDLFTSQATNIVGNLTQIPGISAVSTGGAIAKPIIRGLGYNRVVTLNEGVRQEGNQWGDEHGIEIDQFSADRVEILKGPASLFYGSDAMGGVINILEPLPPPPGVSRGEFSTLFSTNARLTGNSLMTEGNAGGFIWRARASYKNAAAFQSPAEYVYNSGYNETDFNVMTGLNKKWGYTHLHYSHFNTFIGIVEGERDSVTHQFLDSDGMVVTNEILKGRKLQLPLQHITHDKVSSVNNIILGKNQLKVNVGYQQNDRKEHEDSPSDPNLFFRLRTFSLDAKLQIPLKHGFESVFGLSGMSQANVNKGIEFLVPDYDLLDAGGFAYLKKGFGPVTVNGGIRFDRRSVNGKALFVDNGGIPDTVFQGFSAAFSAVSGSFGLVWNINPQSDLKFNIGRAFRAPNIAELGANGVHEGTFRYEIGNSQLKPETSLQFDAEFNYDRDYVSVDVSAYYNLIDEFIYQRNLEGEEIDVEEKLYPVYRYVQGNSLIRGFEISLDIHPRDHFHFENTLAYVRGTNESTGLDLPQIPAMRETHVLRWNIEVSKKSVFRNPYVYCGFSYIWQQDHYDAFETRTGAYGLWKAGVGSGIRIARQVMTVFLEGENLAKKQYYDHLSRLKYAGIYSMGRNITLGLNLPFGFHK